MIEAPPLHATDDGLFCRVKIIPASFPTRDQADATMQMTLAEGKPPSYYVALATEAFLIGRNQLPAPYDSDLYRSDSDSWRYLMSLCYFEDASTIYSAFGDLLEGIAAHHDLLHLDSAVREDFESASKQWKDLLPNIDRLNDSDINDRERALAGFKALDGMLAIWRGLGTDKQLIVNLACDLFDKAQLDKLAIQEITERFQHQVDEYLTQHDLAEMIPLCRERLNATCLIARPTSNRLTYEGCYTYGDYMVITRTISIQLGFKKYNDNTPTDYISACHEKNLSTLFHEMLHAISTSYHIDSSGTFRTSFRPGIPTIRIGFRVRRAFEWFNEGFVSYLQEKFISQPVTSYLPSLATVKGILKIVPERFMAAAFFEDTPTHARNSNWHEMQRELTIKGYGGLLRRIDQISSSEPLTPEQFEKLCEEYPDIFNMEDLRSLR